MNTVNRFPAAYQAELISALKAWMAGSLTEVGVQRVAEKRADEWARPFLAEVTFAERGTPTFWLAELIDALAAMHAELITVDDVPVLLAFVSKLPDVSPDDLAVYEQYWRSIDYDRRRTSLESHPFYRVPWSRK